MVKKLFLAENTAKNIDSYKSTCSTSEATKVVQNQLDETVNESSCTDNNLILNSNHNDIQNTIKVHKSSNLDFKPSRVITEPNENLGSVYLK